MGDFKRLVAWQRAQELVSGVHAAFGVKGGKQFPGLRAQILRAAASIPANLAEGCGKGSRRELARFADIAYASAKEVESHLIAAREAKMIPNPIFENLARTTDDVAKLCYGLTKPARQPTMVSESVSESESDVGKPTSAVCRPIAAGASDAVES